MESLSKGAVGFSMVSYNVGSVSYTGWLRKALRRLGLITDELVVCGLLNLSLSSMSWLWTSVDDYCLVASDSSEKSFSSTRLIDVISLTWVLDLPRPRFSQRRCAVSASSSNENPPQKVVQGPDRAALMPSRRTLHEEAYPQNLGQDKFRLAYPPEPRYISLDTSRWIRSIVHSTTDPLNYDQERMCAGAGRLLFLSSMG
ncbi:uncharacterized protein BDZ83DRAFT_9389 [Colletotrichum acutatum]|uniref:Uncharacterized protein n=1 Tax=Glomerella acutata TaxID=27357 RepID=A0AAD8XQK6_GLOAC|nr:uncharacterized protein BDZ83DRAFT_9389 [Colletotrichum acutatum]KAK1731900.1 hypothetical protein BDZ83DRAFT_9389 [Colletotrichum acutatum]